MPIALIIIGIVLLVTGVRGSQNDLYTQVKSDLTGANSFMHWFVAILIIGAIGYIPELKKFSRFFMALVLIVLVISNGGFFSQFNKQFFGNTPGTQLPTPKTATNTFNA